MNYLLHYEIPRWGRRPRWQRSLMTKCWLWLRFVHGWWFWVGQGIWRHGLRKILREEGMMRLSSPSLPRQYKWSVKPLSTVCIFINHVHFQAAFWFAPGHGRRTSGAWHSLMDNMFNGYHYLSWPHQRAGSRWPLPRPPLLVLFIGCRCWSLPWPHPLFARLTKKGISSITSFLKGQL